MNQSEKTKLSIRAKGPMASTKQIAHENMPSRHSMASITGGDPLRRMMGNYAKSSGEDSGDLLGSLMGPSL